MDTSRISEAPRRYGDVSRFRLHYFLAEDAVEVISVDKRSDDSAPKLLGKRKLLLPEYQHSVNTPTTKTNTYHWTDLSVGGEVIIFNRRAPASRRLRDVSRRWRGARGASGDALPPRRTLKIVDADPFTRKYYEEQGSSLREKIVDPRVDDPGDDPRGNQISGHLLDGARLTG